MVFYHLFTVVLPPNEQQNDHHQTTPKTGCEEPPEKHR